MKDKDQIQIKIFNSENQRTDLLEKKINNWLIVNNEVKILNMLTTSNAYATNEYSAEELYLIVIYKTS